MSVLFVIAVVLTADEEAPPPELVPSPDVFPVPNHPAVAPDEPVVVPKNDFEPEPPNPMWVPTARGSTIRRWGYTEAGLSVGAGTFLGGRYLGLQFLNTTVAGWGFERRGIRVVPSVAFTWGFGNLAPPTNAGFYASPVELRVTAPDILTERITQVRLTPVFGLTVPTGWLARVPLTRITLGFQLERRFGPVEVAWRAEASRSFYLPDRSRLPVEGWGLLNRFFAEAWIQPWVSLAVGLSLVNGWTETPGTPIAQSDLFVTTVQVNFAVHEYGGLTFSMDTTQPTSSLEPAWFPFYAIGNETRNYTSFGLRVWLRTDVMIERNWLDR